MRAWQSQLDDRRVYQPAFDGSPQIRGVCFKTDLLAVGHLYVRLLPAEMPLTWVRYVVPAEPG